MGCRQWFNVARQPQRRRLDVHHLTVFPTCTFETASGTAFDCFVGEHNNPHDRLCGRDDVVWRLAQGVARVILSHSPVRSAKEEMIVHSGTSAT